MRDRPGRDRIIQAFVDLLQKKTPDEMTIKELVRHACVGRSTFYNNFASIPEVAKAVMDGFIQSFRASHVPYHDGEWASFGDFIDDNGTMGIFGFVYEHRREFTALLNSPLRAEFIDQWVGSILEEYERYGYELFYADGTPVNPTEQELSYWLNAIAYSTFAYLEFWSDTGYQETPEELSELVPRLMGISPNHGRRVYRIRRRGE